MSSAAVVLYKEQIDQINEALLRLIGKTEAKCILLVDKDGYLITRQGFTQSLDTTALAALLAGSFASTKEIARLVGEPEFSVLFHQGKTDHIHVCLIGEHSIMAILFDDRTTVGMVRLYAREAVEHLAELMIPKTQGTNVINDEFTSSVGVQIDNIFKE